ncbi:MAG: hypothetical protein U0641_06670 [Anaerolineae bacterium]
MSKTRSIVRGLATAALWTTVTLAAVVVATSDPPRTVSPTSTSIASRPSNPTGGVHGMKPNGEVPHI